MLRSLTRDETQHLRARRRGKAKRNAVQKRNEVAVQKAEMGTMTRVRNSMTSAARRAMAEPAHAHALRNKRNALELCLATLNTAFQFRHRLRGVRTGLRAGREQAAALHYLRQLRVGERAVTDWRCERGRHSDTAGEERVLTKERVELEDVAVSAQQRRG